MRLQQQSNGQVITLSDKLILAVGGEARIFSLPDDPTLVAKVYHKPTPERAGKLVVMAANPPIDPMVGQQHRSIAWPSDLLVTPDRRHRVVGFLMPRVSEMRRVIDYFNPKTRRQECPLFNYFYLHRTARNLVTAVRALHERGYVIGDVNESNVLVSERALVTLVDTDSFQVWDGAKGVVYRCRVGKPEFTPPEMQGKSFAQLDRQPVHDLFGLGVLLFQLLMEGTHPFAGAYTGQGDPPPYEKRIAAGHFPYANFPQTPYKPTPTAPALTHLHPNLQHLFLRCFQDGFLNPALRPDTQSWQWALEEAENALVMCWINDQHLYGSHLNVCPWCERKKLLGNRDPFPSLAEVRRGEHLRPAPRAPTLQTSTHRSTTWLNLPLPRRVPPSSQTQSTTRGGRGRAWHTFGWPRARNYWSWLGLMLGLGTWYLRWKIQLSPNVHSNLFTLGVLTIILGVAGEIRAMCWDMTGRSKLIGRMAMALGILDIVFS